MRITVLALLAAAAYHYDKTRVNQGKKSIFAALGDYLSGNADANEDIVSHDVHNRPM